ncbi:MAG: hypothetical protein WBC65_14510 [Ignavibacteria bacterium]|nr:hypothetical protein [Ignavibacteria bacterium]
MKETLELLNRMKRKGVLDDYAIGGAVASIFYIEPATTYDLDVFVRLPEDVENSLTILKPVFTWLQSEGYDFLGEHILLEGIPVQFIPVYNNLLKEAVENASVLRYDNVPVKVIAPEYLIAIMFQVNRKKDKERALRFFEEYEIDKDKLLRILKEYDLLENYNDFRNQK